LTEEDIENIMVTGLEGGINYWAGLNNTGILWDDKPDSEPNSTWATRILIQGGEVKLFDVEDENDCWVLTLDKLIKGFESNYVKRPHDNNLEQGDATTADCIIQYALFNEIVFG
jgi:hypothetical protein